MNVIKLSVAFFLTVMLDVVMLSAIMQGIIKLSVAFFLSVMLDVIMLSVAAPN